MTGKKSLVLCIAVLLPFLAYGTWQAQNSGTTLTLQGVFFFDSLYGWTAGGENNNGIILKTTDGGQNWNTAYADTPWIFQGVWFIDRQTGWVTGGKLNMAVIDSNCQVILKTTDGGNSWFRQYNHNPNTNWLPLYGVCFIGDAGWVAVTGWADSIGYIIHTTDGGATWTNQSTNDHAASPWDIHFITTSIGVCSGGLNFGYPADNTDGHIWYTTNGGANWLDGYNWRPGSVAMGFLTNIWMTDAGHGWSCGSAGGLSVDEPGKVARTTNGGQSWSSCSPAPLQVFWGLYLPDTLWGWVGAYWSGIMFTSNGGSTWQDDNAGVSRIYDIHGVNRRHVWAVGYNGVIAKYFYDVGIESKNALPDQSIKLQIVPNPFRDKTEIRYHFADNSRVGIKIYDMTGRLVRDFSKLQPATGYWSTVVWDGRDENGRLLPGGVYMLKAEAGQTFSTMELIDIR